MAEKDSSEKAAGTHPEFHRNHSGSKLNWLRAAVLGANDGIVSIAGLVVGVASATENKGVILTAGLAGVIAGAMSMAAGEYVSVSSQRDSERALLEKEKYELKHFPAEELIELENIYKKKGLSPKTAKLVAKELTEHDPFRAHVEVELGINPDELTNPWHAAYASAAAFTIGAAIPMSIILIPPADSRILATFISVIIALMITGYLSARVGGAKIGRAMARVVCGGALAMIITYFIGRLFNVNV
ncbi:MAG TPA: VIT family protein [Candidatus Saccharimonadales bacterium]|nr:VIT family protein [Candidatus Saccharimonadales bacterium]